MQFMFANICFINSAGLSSESTNDGQSTQQTSKSFPTMLKFISGALIGGVNYKEIYMDYDIDDKTSPPITTNNMGENQKYKYAQKTNLA